MTSEISGLFSLTQDFAEKVPQLWSCLEQEVTIPNDNVLQFIGVVDLTQSCFDGTNIHYWAGVELHDGISIPQLPSIISDKLKLLTIPKQTYAVVKHCGPIENLRHTLSWFVLNWLPSSGYRGVDGYELEVYPFGYQAHASDACLLYTSDAADD